jgi:hypothetical protein
MRADLPPLLSAGDRQRLARLLGMVGSNHDGEALNAARLADRLVRDRGARWSDVLDTQAPERLEDIASNWREVATACADNGRDLMTDWEYRFCRTLSGFERCSAKQLSILTRLVDRLAAEGVMT